MKFTVPANAMIVVADGSHASFYRNKANSGVQLEKLSGVTPESNSAQGAASLPTETSPNEKGEADFAKQLAQELYHRVPQGEIPAVVLIADPQTLGQIRPSLHQEVTKRLTGELHKTLTKSSVADIEQILLAAAA